MRKDYSKIMSQHVTSSNLKCITLIVDNLGVVLLPIQFLNTAGFMNETIASYIYI